MYTLVSIVKKEIIYILRDKRTVFLGVIIPIIFMVMYGFFAVTILNDSPNINENISIIRYIYILIITLIMFLSTLTGALELGVGEKERGTLCSLLRTGVDFDTLFIGKLLTLIIQGALTLFLVNITTAILTRIPNNIFNNVMDSFYSNNFFVVLNSFMLINILFFSSIELLISFSVRNFKEGQILSFPLMLSVLIPFYYFLGSKFLKKLFGYYYAVPFFNISAIARDIANNSLKFSNMGIYILITFILVYVIIKFIFIILSKESFLVRR